MRPLGGGTTGDGRREVLVTTRHGERVEIRVANRGETLPLSREIRPAESLNQHKGEGLGGLGANHALRGATGEVPHERE